MTGAEPLPSGLVTLLFTDVEGSTRLWELHADRMPALLAAHDRIVEVAIATWGGTLQRSRAEGDSSFAVFSDARAAIGAAIALQRAMDSHDWPSDLPLRTRAALHTGVVELRAETYYGPVVNRCVKLRALAHGSQTVLSKATLDAALAAGGLPDGATTVDLGTHRLKELAVPERVYELRHPDLRTGFPPLRSPDVARHNLPERRGRFVGRGNEPRAIAKALATERLVTLTGTGGVGKTRLALEVAWARVDEAPLHDPAETWFADLTGARTNEDVDGVLATAIGVREQPGRPLVETITDHLADRGALVIVDNCEHVMEPARRLVRSLLDRCPGVRVLATSREVLGLDGERHRVVPGLLLADAVELFVDRAGLTVAPGSEAEDAVEGLCDRLDGIPYAIEIAAARAEAIGVAAIEEGVARAQVEESGRSVLEATLMWSHDLLAQDEQLMFRRLGAFAGTAPLDGIETVTAFDPIDELDVIDLVGALVEQSLVHRTDTGGYRQLVVAREVAGRLAAAAGEHEVLAARHLSWCLALAQASREPGLDERARVDPLRIVADDLLAALRRPFEGDLAVAQVQLAGALEWFWTLRGAYSEGRSHLESVLARGGGFRSHRAEVHRCAGILAKLQGDLTSALDHLARSRALLEEILDELRGDGSPHVPLFEQHLASTLHQLSEVELERGEPAEAAGLARAALALGGPMAPLAAVAVALAEHALGDAEAADEHLGQALAAAEALGDDRMVADCLRHVGLVARAEGELRRAETHYQRALAIDRGGGAEWRVARALLSLAEVRLLTGDLATDELDEGLELARALGDRPGEAHGLSTLAELTAQTDIHAAEAMHRAALEIRRGVGAPGDVARSRLRVAAFAEASGRLDEAAAETSAAVGGLRQVGDRRGLVEALAQLARIEVRRGELAAAVAALREAVEWSGRIRARVERADLLDAAAWVADSQGRPKDAAALLAAAETARSGLGLVASVTARLARAALTARLGPVVGTGAGPSEPGRGGPDELVVACLV